MAKGLIGVGRVQKDQAMRALGESARLEAGESAQKMRTYAAAAAMYCMHVGGQWTARLEAGATAEFIGL